MKDFKVGEIVHLSGFARHDHKLPDVDYVVQEVLEGDYLHFPLALKSKELGETWVGYFRKEEVVKKCSATN